MRGIAVLLVIFYHAMLHEKKYGHNEAFLPDLLQVGASGVDLFFVISGFVITTVTRGHERNGAAGLFIWNRFTRIYPLFWLYWLLFVLAFHLFPQSMSTATLGSSLGLVKSFLLLPQGQFPVLSVSWTLVHELYFYVVFALFLLFGRRHLAAFLLIFLSVVVLGSLMDHLVGFAGSAWLKVAVHPLTFEFIAGCLVSMLVYDKRVSGRAVESLGLGAASLIVLPVVFLRPLSWEVPEGFARVFLFGAPAAAVVYGAVALEIGQGKKISKALNLIGDASYSIYLSHAMVFSVIGVLFNRQFEAGPNALLVSLMLAGALAWGLVSYFLIERPGLSALRKARAYFFR